MEAAQWRRPTRTKSASPVQTRARASVGNHECKLRGTPLFGMRCMIHAVDGVGQVLDKLWTSARQVLDKCFGLEVRRASSGHSTETAGGARSSAMNSSCNDATRRACMRAEQSPPQFERRGRCTSGGVLQGTLVRGGKEHYVRRARSWAPQCVGSGHLHTAGAARFGEQRVRASRL